MSAGVPDAAYALVDRVRGLPSPPGVAVRLGELISRPRTSAREIAALLSSDPAIASRVLAVANSAQAGCSQRVVTLSHAVMVLGFTTVRNLVVASSLMASLGAGPGWTLADQRLFWRHSLACGAAARSIAARHRAPNLEEYFLLGLLHDVGRAVIGGWLPAEARATEGLDLMSSGEDIDVTAIQVTHSDVGAALLERWQLPSLYVEVARTHHTPALAREGQLAAAIVHVADILAHALAAPPLDGNEPIDEPRVGDEAWALVGLGEDDFEPVLRDTLAAVEETASALESGIRSARS